MDLAFEVTRNREGSWFFQDPKEEAYYFPWPFLLSYHYSGYIPRDPADKSGALEYCFWRFPSFFLSL